MPSRVGYAGLHTHTHVSLLSLPQFKPELVLVSAGFDAARGDPLGGCQVSPEGYAHLTHLLMGLANGRIILILEVTCSVPLPTVGGWFGKLEVLPSQLAGGDTRGNFLNSALSVPAWDCWHVPGIYPNTGLTAFPEC